jgi:hypothetical protein
METKLEKIARIQFFQEIDWIICNNFHVVHRDWIATNFEIKFKYKPELEFDLNSNRI